MKAILATLSDSRTIGRGDKLPWDDIDELKDAKKIDMSIFVSATSGHDILMGYKTWLSIGHRCLKNRGTHYILTRKNLDNDDPQIKYINSIDELPEDTSNIYLIGGATLYNELLPQCDSIIHVKYDSDSRETIEKIKDFVESSNAVSLKDTVENLLGDSYSVSCSYDVGFKTSNGTILTKTIYDRKHEQT